MSEKLTKFLNGVLEGVVAENSLPDFDTLEDSDLAALVNDVRKKYKQRLSSEFKGQYYDTATKEFLRGLQTHGILTSDQTNEFSTLKFDELTGRIAEIVNAKQAEKMTDGQKEVAAQVEKAKKAIEEQYRQQLTEVAERLKGYEVKETESKVYSAINSALPKGFTPTTTQLKALKSLLDSEVDIKFNENGSDANLFYKGTETIYGLNGEKKQILGLGDIVPKYLKDLGIWSEKPKPEVKDFSNANGQNTQTPVTVNQNGSLNKRKEAAKEFLKNLQ